MGTHTESIDPSALPRENLGSMFPSEWLDNVVSLLPCFTSLTALYTSWCDATVNIDDIINIITISTIIACLRLSQV